MDFMKRFSTAPSNDPKNKVSDLVKRSHIVLLIKGNPNEPRCGYSNAVCRILEAHGILEKVRKGDDPNLFAAYAVLGSKELRAASRVFADWHNFP
ncbi:hypothetical protein MN116_003167 [Schistosoma mekongi]|uniref:Glutaredoxin domain-containing protein n=1 Tax=Schistosoma mekongi TaxID=38744 RepID=A0AAE1ZI38_SCHME|nr:hypothetical protein MN116_003167 [Schistosoma mekongi]